MNTKLIASSGFCAALAGAIIGFAAAEISQNEFESPIYQDLPAKFAIAGAVFGVVTGASLESIRQLKEQQDREWQDDR